MSATDFLAELEKCVRCGSCKAYCPTYDEGLTEAMGARGRLTILRGLLNHKLDPSEAIRDRISSCILCSACESLCPPRVEITEAIYHGRKMLSSFDRKRLLRGLLLILFKRPAVAYRIGRFLQHLGLPPHTLLSLARAARKTFPAKNSASGFFTLPLPDTMLLPPHPLKDDQQVYRPERKIGRVALFTGCSTNFLFPHLGISLINVLMLMGYEVVLPKGEVCCGAPLRSLGMEEEALSLAKKNTGIFGRLNAEAVLSLCPTCVLSLRSHYPKILGKEIGNVTDVSTFLIQRLDPQRFPRLQTLSTVTYHDPCHMSYSMNIRREPRELIRNTGLTLIDADSEGCCGFGGIFCAYHQDLSKSLLEKRCAAYRATGAQAIVTACPGCMMHLSAGSGRQPVYHIIELIDEALSAARKKR